MDIFRIYLEFGIHAIKNLFDTFLLNNSWYLLYSAVFICDFLIYFVKIFLLKELANSAKVLSRKQKILDFALVGLVKSF